MSSSSHSFGLDFADRATAPLHRIEKALERVSTLPERISKSLSKMNAILTGTTVYFDKVSGRWHDLSGKFISEADAMTRGTDKWRLGLIAASSAIGVTAAAVGGLVSLMAKGIGVAWDFGKTLVDAAKERGLLKTAYGIMLGSPEKAEAQIQKTLDIASLTPASNMEVIDLTKRLLTAGVTGHKLDAARASALDIQAAFGNARSNQYTYLLSKLYSRGELTTADVNSAGRYINARYVRESIASQVGSRVGYKQGGPYTDQIDKRVRDLISSHGVTSDMGATAFQEALLRSLKQKTLGTYSIKKGQESLAGLLSNLEEVIPTFLMRLKIDEFAGIKQLKVFLQDILSFFDISTKEGKMLASVVEEITNALFGGLKNITKDDMGRFFQAGLNVARQLVGVIKDLWDLVGKILHGDWVGAIGGAVNVLIDVAHVIGAALWEGIKAAMMPGGASATDLAGRLLNGGGGDKNPVQVYDPAVVAKIRASMKEVGEAGAEGMKEGAAGPQGLDNRSPSHALQRIGIDGAQGLIKGAKDGLRAGRGAGSVEIHGDVHITVRADTVDEEVRFRDWLTKVLREAQHEVGA